MKIKLSFLLAVILLLSGCTSLERLKRMSIDAKKSFQEALAEHQHRQHDHEIGLHAAGGMHARQLLQRTRLLRQSPVVTDNVQLRNLLDDVELILLQIATFAHGGDARELDFVEQGMTERSVMLRLRSAVPAAPQHPFL